MAVPFITGVRRVYTIHDLRERNINRLNTAVNVNDRTHRTNATLYLFLILRLRAGGLFSRFLRASSKKTYIPLFTRSPACPFPSPPLPSCYWNPRAFARATPFTSNGSAFFTSKRVFHTHVTGSAKTDWKCARGRARFPSIVAGDRDKGWNYNLSSTLERAEKCVLGDNSSSR